MEKRLNKRDLGTPKDRFKGPCAEWKMLVASSWEIKDWGGMKKEYETEQVFRYS